MKKARKINKSWLPAGRKYLTGGFTMFLALIVMGALVLIAFSVINISVRETELSTYNRESQYAIFAADAGIECALYYDAKPAISAFATSTTGIINCAGNGDITTGTQIIPTPPTPISATSRIGGGTDTNPTSIFFLEFDKIGSNHVDACAIVTVNKDFVGPGNTLPLITKIESKGYNTCNTSDPRRVERAIEVTY